MIPPSACRPWAPDHAARIHRSYTTRWDTIAAGASILYLPPYSSGLNLIEQAFTKFKALLRRAAARTKVALWTTIEELLRQFSQIPELPYQFRI